MVSFNCTFGISRPSFLDMMFRQKLIRLDDAQCTFQFSIFLFHCGLEFIQALILRRELDILLQLRPILIVGFGKELRTARILASHLILSASLINKLSTDQQL